MGPARVGAPGVQAQPGAVRGVGPSHGASGRVHPRPALRIERGGGTPGRGSRAALASDSEALRRELPGADALIVDLTFDTPERIEHTRLFRPAGVPVLAFYSHVETDVRDLAERAGFDLVVPRSRMAREGAALTERLLAR